MNSHGDRAAAAPAPPRRAARRRAAPPHLMSSQNEHAGKRLRAPFDRFIVDGFNFCRPDVRHYFH